MARITFDNVVVFRIPLTESILFHELVHVEQYRQLGVQRLAELYLTGFMRGGGYEEIPMEANAYELGRRFEANPCSPFSVEAEVRSWIHKARF